MGEFIGNTWDVAHVFDMYEDIRRDWLTFLVWFVNKIACYEKMSLFL